MDTYKGDPGIMDTIQERMHKSLPQPLKLKIVVTDNFGKQCSLIVEQLNKPLELITRKTYLKNKQSEIIEFLAFVYADNLENDERMYVAMYINKDDKLVITKYNIHSTWFELKVKPLLYLILKLICFMLLD
jgi:hypothetical protein